MGTIRGRQRFRSGSSTLESIIVLPVLVIVIVVTVQFGAAMLVGHSVTHAATVGAREAAQGATIGQIRAAVESILKPHKLQMGANASVILEDPTMGGFQQSGTLPCTLPTSPPTGSLAANERRVTVCVKMDASPMLNSLTSLGLDVSDRTITRSALVRVE